MENTQRKEELVAQRFREEIEAISECQYCHTSGLIGGVTSPAPEGNRLIFCLNHKNGGVILARFQYDPA